MIASVEHLAESVSLWKACQALAVLCSGLYRQRRVTESQGIAEPTLSLRALQSTEKVEVRQVLNSARFADQAPREVYASLKAHLKTFHQSPRQASGIVVSFPSRMNSWRTSWA